MNKKNNIILVIAIIIFIGLILFLIKNNTNTNNTNTKEGTLIEITYEQVKEKINNKEDFIITLSQTTCSHCAEFKPILKTVAQEYNITIYYLDYDKYEENKEIIELFNFNGATPTTFFYKDGKEISIMNRLIGSKSKSTVITTLKKLEYIENE